MSHSVGGLSITRHWAWGAVLAALCSLAHAGPPRGPHDGAGYAAAPATTAYTVYNPNMHRLAGSPGYAAGIRGSMQYAGAITPVSAESHGAPRPPVNAPVRTGSIRADVARYNEERGASRNVQRQSDDPRPPDGSPYRN